MPDRGAVPPILFLHGVFGRPALLKPWNRYFQAAGFETHAPTLPAATRRTTTCYAGKPERADQLLTDALRVAHLVDNPRQAAACLEALAWIAGALHDPRRAATLTAAAAALGRSVGASTAVLPHLLVFHEECDSHVREALGDKEFEAANQEGSAMSFDEAIAYAIATDDQ
ncbi:MAG: hypothetical protein ABWY20_10340 [Mycobacterium sp.]